MPHAHPDSLRGLLAAALATVPEPLALEVLRGLYAQIHERRLRAEARRPTRGEQVLAILRGSPPMRVPTLAGLLVPEYAEGSRTALNLVQITLSRLKAQGKVTNSVKGFWEVVSCPRT